VFEILAEDDESNWIGVCEDSEGFAFFIIHLANHSLELYMPEEGLEQLYALLHQVFKRGGGE